MPPQLPQDLIEWSDIFSQFSIFPLAEAPI